MMEKKDTRLVSASDDVNMQILTELVKTGQKICVSPRGMSMWPLFMGERDSVVLAPITRKLRRGDVVLYQLHDGTYVIHRIYSLSLKFDTYRMLGDGNIVIEPPLERERIYAIAIEFIRKGKVLHVNALWYNIYWRLWGMCLPKRKKLISIFAKIAKRRQVKKEGAAKA